MLLGIPCEPHRTARSHPKSMRTRWQHRAQPTVKIMYARMLLGWDRAVRRGMQGIPKSMAPMAPERRPKQDSVYATFFTCDDPGNTRVVSK